MSAALSDKPPCNGFRGNRRNSLVYSAISCTLLIVICAPAAYVLARFIFPGNKLIQAGFVSAMGVPVIMIILPLFGIVANMGILNHILSNAVLLSFLYIGINVLYTMIFLMTFSAIFPKPLRKQQPSTAVRRQKPFG